MRRLLIILSVILLPGCALYDAYMMTGFDNNEYLLVTQIRVDAQTYRPQCNNPVLAAQNATAIAAKTNLFEKYSQWIPNNANGYNSSKSLNAIAQGLATAYDKQPAPSTLFCQLKYSGIENAATVIQHVVGDRPR
jgi:hypothetical protein